MKLYFHCGPLKTVVGYIDIRQQQNSKIQVDIVSDTDISIMLLLLMITIMMIILLPVLLLLQLTSNESNDCNDYNNNNVIIIKTILAIKKKSGCALK